MKCKKMTAVLLSLSMIVSGVAVTPPTSADAASKKVTLSAKKLTVIVGQTQKLKLKNNKKKVTWTVTFGKKNITLKSKKKTGVTVVGKKKGSAKVQAKIGKKKYTCKVTVKVKAKSKATATPKPTAQPTKVPTTTTEPTGTPAPQKITSMMTYANFDGSVVGKPIQIDGTNPIGETGYSVGGYGVLNFSTIQMRVKTMDGTVKVIPPLVEEPIYLCIVAVPRANLSDDKKLSAETDVETRWSDIRKYFSDDDHLSVKLKELKSALEEIMSIDDIISNGGMSEYYRNEVYICLGNVPDPLIANMSGYTTVDGITDGFDVYVLTFSRKPLTI